MAYGDFKYLPRRTASAKVLRDKAFNIAKEHKKSATHTGTRIIFNSPEINRRITKVNY